MSITPSDAESQSQVTQLRGIVIALALAAIFATTLSNTPADKVANLVKFDRTDFYSARSLPQAFGMTKCLKPAQDLANAIHKNDSAKDEAVRFHQWDLIFMLSYGSLLVIAGGTRSGSGWIVREAKSFEREFASSPGWLRWLSSHLENTHWITVTGLVGFFSDLAEYFLCRAFIHDPGHLTKFLWWIAKVVAVTKFTVIPGIFVVLATFALPISKGLLRQQAH